jgi:DNA-binding CsgD family transcriptional regulator
MSDARRSRSSRLHAAQPSAVDWVLAERIVADGGSAESVVKFAEFLTVQLKQLFCAELVVWDRFARDGRPLAFRLSDDLGDVHAKLRPAFLTHFADHPFAHDLPELHQTGRIIVLSDRISDRAFRRTALWNEVYIHLRARYQLAFGGPLDSSSTWCLGMNRLTRDFGPRERELARFLQPRIASVFLSLTQRERAVRAAGMTTAAFNSPDAAYLIIDREGTMLEISEAASHLLATAASGSRDHARASNLASDLSSLASRLRPPAATSTARMQSPWIFGDVGVAQALAMRVDNTDTILVLLQPHDASDSPVAAAALSKREIEVLRWIGRGKSNAEIAAVLGISARTVAKHCESLFAKLGVENRVAAALLARRESS